MCIRDRLGVFGPDICALHQLHAQGILPIKGCLLPKLQHQFAEFLSYISLKHLRILFYPTCVGFRYGRFAHSYNGFSGKHGIGESGLAFASPSHWLSELCKSMKLAPPTALQCHIQQAPHLSSFVFAVLKHGQNGIGILTYSPSTTPLGLALGSD